MHKKEFFMKYGYALIVILLLIIFFRQSYHNISEFPTYKEFTDQVHHLNATILFSHQMDDIVYENQGLPTKFIRIVQGLKNFTLQKNWPTLTYAVTYGTSKFFGTGIVATEMGSLIFFALMLLYAFYLLGDSCFERNVGLTAGLILFSYPLIVLFSRGYGLDYPLTAFTTLTIALLIKTDYFSRRWWSLFFGISLGLGILTKAQIVLFVLGPLGYVIWRGTLSSDTPEVKRHRVVNCATALLLAALISSIWWSNNIMYIVTNFVSHARNESFTGYIQPFTWEWARFYSRAILQGSNIFLLPLFFFGLYALICQKRRVSHAMIFVLWLAIPYLIFTCIQTKALRFYLPALPAVALITSYGMHSLRSKLLKTVFIICIGGTLISEGLFTDPQNNYYHQTPSNYQHAVKRIVDTIQQEKEPDKRVIVGLVENQMYFTTNSNAAVVCYFISRSIPQSTCILSKVHQNDFLAQPDRFDFLLVGLDNNDEPKLPEPFLKKQWQFLYQVTLLGDGTKVHVFKRTRREEPQA